MSTICLCDHPGCDGVNHPPFGTTGRVVRIEVEWLMREGESPNIPEALQQVVEGLTNTAAKRGMICNSQGWRVGDYSVAIEV